MSARLKWGLYFAKVENDEIIPLKSAKKYGEGHIDEIKIKNEIIPYTKKNELQLPILIKTYYSKKPSGLTVTKRGGKPAFDAAYPIRERFIFLITEKFQIQDVSKDNIGNLEKESLKS